jgi:hypothetical protein
MEQTMVTQLDASIPWRDVLAGKTTFTQTLPDPQWTLFRRELDVLLLVQTPVIIEHQCDELLDDCARLVNTRQMAADDVALYAVKGIVHRFHVALAFVHYQEHLEKNRLQSEITDIVSQVADQLLSIAALATVAVAAYSSAGGAAAALAVTPDIVANLNQRIQPEKVNEFFSSTARGFLARVFGRRRLKTAKSACLDALLRVAEKAAGRAYLRHRAHLLADLLRQHEPAIHDLVEERTKGSLATLPSSARIFVAGVSVLPSALALATLIAFTGLGSSFFAVIWRVCAWWLLTGATLGPVQKQVVQRV